MPITTSTTLLPGDGVTLTADLWCPESPTGKGTVVLLHGGGQTRHSWQRTGTRLAEHGWRTYAVDARGHGDSEWASDGDYTTEAYARDLVAMVAAIGEAPVLVGASMGGTAALIAQADHPGSSRALVLVDVVPRAEPEGLAKITGFLKGGLAGFDTIDDALDAVVDYNPHRRRPPSADGLLKNLRERDGRWYWHWDPRLLSDRTKTLALATTREIRARAAARTITIPTLLIRGAQSNIVSAEGARELLELIPGSRHVDVSGAGHMVSGDDNDVLSEGLVEFLSDL